MSHIEPAAKKGSERCQIKCPFLLLVVGLVFHDIMLVYNVAEFLSGDLKASSLLVSDLWSEHSAVVCLHINAFLSFLSPQPG